VTSAAIVHPPVVAQSLNWFRNLPIRRKLTYLMLTPTAVGLLFSAAALISNAATTAHATAERDLQTTTQVMADNAAAAVAFRDRNAAEEILSALRFKTETETACLYVAEAGEPARLLAGYVTRGAPACAAEPGHPRTQEEGASLVSVSEVRQAGGRVGWLSIRQSLGPLQQALASQIGITLATLIGSFAATLLIGFGTYRVLAQPLLSLAQVARRVSQTHEFRARAEKFGDDELGRLVDDFNNMLGHIAQRDSDLQSARNELARQVEEKTRANTDLEQTLTRLRETQSQLVQSERLASLGGLVAGVAHEINTPVGVGVTAASSLRDYTAQIAALYRHDQLKRSDLEQFIATADEAADITLRNLQRAAELIQSFKQVAVDQSSGERRQFALRAYIDEVLLSLAPRLKRFGVPVEVECPPTLMVDTYPGAIAQILTNFVSNSLTHGYAPGEKGHLTIRVTRDGDQVCLRYADDGRGIPPEHVARIFDPFFTTRRGSGGSGLGLHVVFNLVHQLLGGTIDVSSQPARGAEFSVRFPAVAPRNTP
jgi:two-component system NtrC family sensor kinase